MSAHLDPRTYRVLVRHDAMAAIRGLSPRLAGKMIPIQPMG